MHNYKLTLLLPVEEALANGTDNDEDDEVSALAANFTQKVNLTKRLDLSKQQLSELPSESMRFTEDIPGIILLSMLCLSPYSISQYTEPFYNRQ
jgi:hypothetical protein